MFDGLSRDRLERYIFSLTDDAFSRVVHQAAEGRDISEENLRSIASFCRYAFIGFVMQFFWNSMENDIDESVDRLGTLFDSFLHGALQTAEYIIAILCKRAVSRTGDSSFCVKRQFCANLRIADAST